MRRTDGPDARVVASETRPARRATLVRALGAGCLLAAVAASVLTERRIAARTITVTILGGRRDAVGEREARALRDPRDDVAEIYGTPIGAPYEVVDPEPARPAWFSPPEEPDRRLLPLERASGFPRPARVRLEGHGVAAVLAVAGSILLGVARARRRPA